MALIRKAAEDYGRTSPNRDGSRKKFGREMFAWLCRAETLYVGWEGLKGEAPGADGVAPGDIGRYAAYRRWLEDAALHGSQAPGFADTLFADSAVPPGALTVLQVCGKRNEWGYATLAGKTLYCAAAHVTYADPKDAPHAVKKDAARHVVRGAGGAMRDEWFRNQPLDVLLDGSEADVRRFFEEAEERGFRPSLRKDDVFSVDHGVDRELLRRAGVDGTTLLEAGRRVNDALGEARRWLALSGARVYAINLRTWICGKEGARDPDEAARKHLTWEAMRWIGGLLEKMDADGRGYKPRPLRRVEIPKPDGGVRVLSIPTVVDRVVSRAALVLLGPMFEQVFLPSSVGCRESLDRFDALAGLRRHYPEAPGKFILCADIRKAFDNVPHDALLEVLFQHIGNPDMRRLLERLVRRPGFGNGVGIAQGDPLSPLFLNLLLHERLDRPLQALLPPGAVYYRYVDDLSLFGFRSRGEGLALIGTIQSLLAPVGLELHPDAGPGPHAKPPKTQIVDLASAGVERECEPVEDGNESREVDRYLGLGLRGGPDGQLAFFLPSPWREQIRTMFREAEASIARKGYAGTKGAERHIQHAAESWLRAFSPAWTRESAEAAPAEVVAIAQGVSRHTGLLSAAGLARVWRASREWWEDKCRAI